MVIFRCFPGSDGTGTEQGRNRESPAVYPTSRESCPFVQDDEGSSALGPVATHSQIFCAAVIQSVFWGKRLVW